MGRLMQAACDLLLAAVLAAVGFAFFLLAPIFVSILFGIAVYIAMTVCAWFLIQVMRDEPEDPRD